VELLHAIGFVYTSKARHFLATNQTFMGVGGWLHGVQSKYHVFSETCVSPLSLTLALALFPHTAHSFVLTHRYWYSVSTVRAALEVKQVFEQLAEAEKAGVTPEQKQKLEEQATEKVCLWSPMTTGVLFVGYYVDNDDGADPTSDPLFLFDTRFLGRPSAVQG
jgi:X-domain of DnaJ-containing